MVCFSKIQQFRDFLEISLEISREISVAFVHVSEIFVEWKTSPTAINSIFPAFLVFLFSIAGSLRVCVSED